MIQVVTTYKVITKKVPRLVAERKKWKKFGSAAGDGPGPQISTTYVADDVEIQFRTFSCCTYILLILVKKRPEDSHEDFDDRGVDPILKATAYKGILCL